MADITRTIDIVVNTEDATKDIEKLNRSLEENEEQAEETTKETKKYEKQLEDTSKVTGVFTQQLDKMTGGMFSTVKGILGSVKALKSLRVALIATGLGAVLVLVGSLAAAFTRMQGPMNLITDIFSGLGSVMNNILDRLGLLGEAIIKFIQGDFTGAWETAKKSVDNLNESLQESFKLGQDISEQAREIDLLEAQRGVQIANNRREIERLVFLSRDYTKSEQERFDAVKAASALERENVALVIDLERQKLELAQKRYDDSSKNEPALIEFLNQQAQITQTITQSEAKLRELRNREGEALTKILALEKQRNAEIDKRTGAFNQQLQEEIDLENLLNEELEEQIDLENELSTIKSSASEESSDIAKEAVSDQDNLTSALGATGQAAQGVLDILAGKTTGKDIFKFFLTTLGSILSLTSGGATGGIFSVIGGLFADGGLLQGPSHAQGGVWVNAEGGEGIINKRSMAIPWVRDLASELNQLGGGVKFADGGIVPGQTAQEAQISQLAQSLQDQRIVLPIEDLYTVNARVQTVEDRATL
jgi:hypothetical protein